MSTFIEFLSSNAAVLASLLALAISLRANYTADRAHKLNRQTKADNDRVLLFEKKRELLNEVDRQNARFATLTMVLAQKILLFREHPWLHDEKQDEFDRLKSNLVAVQKLASRYEEQRTGIEATDVGADIAFQDQLLANIRRLTIHVEKDIAHEQVGLLEIQSLVKERLGA